MKVISSLRLERREQPSGGMILIISLLATLLALLVAGFIFWIYGINPFHVYWVIIDGSLGSSYVLSETIRRAVPLLITGVGLALAFRVSFWNIGAEGQILAGATAATWIALFSGIPEPLMIWVMFPVGFMAGALWGVVVAILRSKLEVSEIVTTIMMNIIAAHIVVYLIHNPWKGQQVRGYALTDIFPEAAWLPTLGTTRIAIATVVIGLLAAILVHLFVTRTTHGFEAKVFGESPKAGRYAGMSYTKTVVLVMIISGGLAGLAGVGEVTVIHHRLQPPAQVSLGYGFTAIIVVWLARTNPLAVIPAAFFFGALLSGGDAMKISLGIPYQVTSLFNGLILLFLIGGEGLMRYKISFGPFHSPMIKNGRR